MYVFLVEACPVSYTCGFEKSTVIYTQQRYGQRVSTDYLLSRKDECHIMKLVCLLVYRGTIGSIIGNTTWKAKEWICI